jgi:hypothetical protein
MRVPALLLLLIAAVTLCAILGLIAFLPLLGFAKRQLAEYEDRIKIERLGRPIKSETDSRVVISASNRLREMFNEGGCEPIYREADNRFRLGPVRQWTAQCKQLRRRLGEWRSFEVEKTINCSTDNSQICIIGLASFTNGSYPFQVAWNLTGARLGLFAFFLGALILSWEPSPFEPKPQLVAGPCDSRYESHKGPFVRQFLDSGDSPMHFGSMETYRIRYSCLGLESPGTAAYPANRP